VQKNSSFNISNAELEIYTVYHGIRARNKVYKISRSKKKVKESVSKENTKYNINIQKKIEKLVLQPRHFI
jgi:hypothetical protein